MSSESSKERAQIISSLFIETLNLWKKDNEIFKMYNLGYSPLQVVKLWLYETNEEIRSKKVVINSKDFFPFNRTLDTGIATRLKRHVAYTQEQHMIHLKKPQEWKIMCNHLGKSEKEISSLVEEQLKNWAKSTQDKRRNQKNYDPSNFPEYWEERLGLSREEACEKARMHKREKSPFTVDHWLKKGLQISEARACAKRYHVKGGIAATQKQGSIATSRKEIMLFDSLSAVFPDLISQYSIDDIYVYDMCLPRSKKIVEFNGTYWHADPRVYEKDKTIRGVKASEIHNRDAKKIGYAKKSGYDVLVVWEIDLCKSWESNLELIKSFLSKD